MMTRGLAAPVQTVFGSIGIYIYIMYLHKRNMVMEHMEYNMEYTECRECMECMKCMEYIYIYILSIAWNIIYSALHSYGTYHMCIYVYIYTYTWILLWKSYAWDGTWDIGHMCVYIYIYRCVLCLKSNYVLLCME